MILLVSNVSSNDVSSMRVRGAVTDASHNMSHGRFFHVSTFHVATDALYILNENQTSSSSSVHCFYYYSIFESLIKNKIK